MVLKKEEEAKAKEEEEKKAATAAAKKIVEEMKKLWDGQVHDVLSFSLELDKTYPDGVIRLGDIVICDQEKDIESLVKHGCLHLLGIHHLIA